MHCSFGYRRAAVLTAFWYLIATIPRDNLCMSKAMPLARLLPLYAEADTHITANPEKKSRGLGRVWHAFGYSLARLRAGKLETAFRQEAIASVALSPAAFWLGRSWAEAMLLSGTVVLVMIVELLNTGIETAINRIGPAWHDLFKPAKNMCSAAVLLSLLLCWGAWVSAAVHRFAL